MYGYHIKFVFMYLLKIKDGQLCMSQPIVYLLRMIDFNNHDIINHCI